MHARSATLGAVPTLYNVDHAKAHIAAMEVAKQEERRRVAFQLKAGEDLAKFK
jgi:hypothetical protein